MGVASWTQTRSHLRSTPGTSRDWTEKRAAMKQLLETEVRRLERLLPGLASTQGQAETEQPDMEEILAVTISYISLLHSQVVGRVRTHGQTYFRGKLGEAGAGAITETSSKE